MLTKASSETGNGFLTGIESNAKMIGVGVVILQLLQGVYGENISVQLPERSISVFCSRLSILWGGPFFEKKQTHATERN